MHHLARVHRNPGASLDTQWIGSPGGLQLDSPRVFSTYLSKMNDPGETVAPPCGARAAHFVVTLQGGIKDQCQGRQPLVKNGGHALLIGTAQGRARFMHIENVGLCPQINLVVEIGRDVHLKRAQLIFLFVRNAIAARGGGCPGHVQPAGLHIADLFMGQKFLELAD